MLFATLLILKLNAQVTSLQRKIDVLLDHFSVDLAEVAKRKAVELLKSHKKIDAINIYRELTGGKFAEVEATIDEFARELPEDAV